jgi:hypothetical protein
LKNLHLQIRIEGLNWKQIKLEQKGKRTKIKTKLTKYKTPTIIKIDSIVIKSGPGVDPVKGRGPEFHESTWINPEKLKIYI